MAVAVPPVIGARSIVWALASTQTIVEADLA
jgi:hypothetical protein